MHGMVFLVAAEGLDCFKLELDKYLDALEIEGLQGF